MRLSAAIQRFNTQLRADGKSEHTCCAYIRDLAELKNRLNGDPDIATITPSTIAGHLTSKALTGRPPVSLNRGKTALRVFFRFLMDSGYIKSNPARLIKNGRCEQKVPEHLTAVEVRRFLQSIPKKDGFAARRDRLMCMLLLQTGIRLGSLVQLMVRDARLTERRLVISAKGGIEQRVYLNSKLRRRLTSYIAAADLALDDPLFPSQHGGPLCRRQVQLKLKDWLKRAGIKRHLTVHSLRHTFAVNLYRKTGDLRLVQTALGHKRITTTEIYARVDDSRLKRALENL